MGDGVGVAVGGGGSGFQYPVYDQEYVSGDHQWPPNSYHAPGVLAAGGL